MNAKDYAKLEYGIGIDRLIYNERFLFKAYLKEIPSFFMIMNSPEEAYAELLSAKEEMFEMELNYPTMSKIPLPIPSISRYQSANGGRLLQM